MKTHNTLAQLKITALLLILLSSCVDVQSNTFFYITHMNKSLSNHSYVKFNRLENNSLQCHANYRTCCSNPQIAIGWKLPDGSRINEGTHSSSRSVYQTRHPRRIDLHYRQRSPVISGIYSCSIEREVIGHRSVVFVGVYFSGGEEM